MVQARLNDRETRVGNRRDAIGITIVKIQPRGETGMSQPTGFVRLASTVLPVVVMFSPADIRGGAVL